MTLFRLRVSVNRADALKDLGKDENFVTLTGNPARDSAEIGIMILQGIQMLQDRVHLSQVGIVLLFEEIQDIGPEA